MRGIWHGDGERIFRQAAFHSIGKKRFPIGLDFTASRRNVFSWRWILQHGGETVSRIAGLWSIAGKPFSRGLGFAVSWKSAFPKGWILQQCGKRIVSPCLCGIVVKQRNRWTYKKC